MQLKLNDDWPFDQPPNCATLTTRRVLDGSEPILFATHDADDHGWQFLGSTRLDRNEPQLVSLRSIVLLDPTVLEVADLPPGWQAIRAAAGKPWSREAQADASADSA